MAKISRGIPGETIATPGILLYSFLSGTDRNGKEETEMTANAKARIALISIVCAIVFRTSFSHIVTTAMMHGNDFSTAVTYPVCIDALILVCALTLIARTGVNKSAKFWCQIGRVFGFAATIFCNVAASNFASTMDAIVCLLPAVSLIIVVEIMVHSFKGTGRRTRTA